MFFAILLFASLSAQDNTTYYVTTSGSDTGTCGARTGPCASINWVLTNYQGASFTVVIDSGIYEFFQTKLQRNSFVVFQGAVLTSIEAKWDSDSHQVVVLPDASGVKFHDLALFFFGDGSTFTTLSDIDNTAGFYNVVLTYVGYEGVFVDLYAGELYISNLKFDTSVFKSAFIHALPIGDNTLNVSIIGSNFTGLNIQEKGAFFDFATSGPANILIDSTYFSRISTENMLFGFWVTGDNQTITLSSNVFADYSSTNLSTISIYSYYQSLINIQNSSWTNVTANTVSAALMTRGKDAGQNSVITLNNLSFVSCKGIYAGALFFLNNSFVLSDSTFANNSGKYASDIYQMINMSNLEILWPPFDISNTFSSSALPRGEVSWVDTNSAIKGNFDNQLPDPPQEDDVGASRSGIFQSELRLVADTERIEEILHRIG